MGIESQFVKILRDLVGGWPESSVESLSAATLVVEDFELRRNLTFGASSWEVLREGVQRYVLSKFIADVNTYFMTFDFAELVPPSKRVEQDARDGKDPRDPPFTPAELVHIDVGTSALPPDAAAWFKRMWKTRALRAEIAAFMAAAAVSTPGLPEGATIIVDAVDCALFKKHCPGAKDAEQVEAASAGAAAGQGDSMRRVVATGGTVVMDMEYIRLGEGDFKLPRVVAMQPDGAIVNVISGDSDMLLIFMLQYMRWFRTGASTARWTVHLDANTPNGELKPWIDVKELWRKVIDTFDRRFGWVAHPVHMLCLVIILAGNDFAKSIGSNGQLCAGLEGIGPVAVWRAFQAKEASGILGGQVHPLFDTAMGYDAMKPCSIGVNETRVVNFIFLMYHKIVFGDYPDKQFFKAGVYDSTQLREKHIARGLKRALPKDKDITAFVRRITWSMYYMVNGSSSRAPWVDPVAINMQGVSIHGWTFDAHTGRVQLTSDTTSTVFRQ